MQIYKKFDLLNLLKLSRLSGISYNALYARKIGRSKSDMSLNDRTRVVNAIVKELKPLFKHLGFNLTVSPLD